MSEKTKHAFIIGTGRCGTSWLGQMLNSNTELCVPPEIQLLFEYAGNGNRLYEEYCLANFEGLDGEQLALIIERGCPHKLEDFFDYGEFCRRENTPKKSLVEFVTSFYSAIAEKHGKTWLIEQTPWYGQRLDLVSKLFPDGKFIHVVRDGRDVALSFARTTWWHRSPHLNLARWQREIKKIVLDASCYLSSDSYMEVRYEDLVADPEFELKRICSFLGVDFYPMMLDPTGFIDYDKFCKFDMMQVSSQAYTVWCEQKKEAVFSDNVQAWRKADKLFDGSLPDELADWLSRYGYEVPASVTVEAEAEKPHFREYSFNALEHDNIAQAQYIQKLEKALNDNVETLSTVENEWSARGDLLKQLGNTIEGLEQESTKRADHIHTLEQTLSKQAEQAGTLQQDWQARGDLLDQLGKNFQTLENECELRAGYIQALEQSIAEKLEQIVATDKNIEARNALFDQLNSTLNAMRLESKAQAEQIEHLMMENTERSDENALLRQEVDDQKKLIEELEDRLNEFRRSWFGILRKHLGK